MLSLGTLLWVRAGVWCVGVLSVSCACRCACSVCVSVCACRCVWCGTLKTSVCGFKTVSCVPAKRPCHIRHGRFAGTHGGVLNLHTEAFWIYAHTHTRHQQRERRTDTDRRLSSKSTSLFTCLSFFLTPLFLFALSAHLSLSSILSLCSQWRWQWALIQLAVSAHTALTCPVCQSALALAHSLVDELLASCKKRV